MKKSFPLIHSVFIVFLSTSFCFAQRTNSEQIKIDRIGAANGFKRYTREQEQPYGVAIDGKGNYYVVDIDYNHIRKVNSKGIISIFAGDGYGDYGGDGGDATAAKLNMPCAVAADAAGNVYIADKGNGRIRKINSSGIITTIAGTGTGNGMNSDDGGAATATELGAPSGVAVDGEGNVYISCEYGYRIRKVNSSGIITTIAGTGLEGFSGDGGLAITAEISKVTGIAVDAAGNVYIADNGNNRIRKINTKGIINTFAGNGKVGSVRDGSVATTSPLACLSDVSVDGVGNVYISNVPGREILKINSSGIITTFGTTFDGKVIPRIVVKQKQIIKNERSRLDSLIEIKRINEVAELTNKKKKNFNIPINPEESVEPGTLPVLQDSDLNSISFACDIVAVVWKGEKVGLNANSLLGGGVGYAGRGNHGFIDTSSHWELKLTRDKLFIQSSNGIAKTYRVLNIHYNEEFRMQEFDLGDITGKKTHTLYVSWEKRDKIYVVILTSIDNSEENQFNIDEEYAEKTFN